MIANAADLSSASISSGQNNTQRWTGFYLGFNRGFGGGVIDNGLILSPLNATPGIVGQSSNRSSGFIAGGQVGYNYQFANNFVLGV